MAVGERVTRFAVGDAVFGIGSGAFAEYAVASEEKLVHLPDGVGFEAAAVSAISGITALQALTDVGGLEEDQRVLIIGASGGVGTFALQLAVALGARVTAVAGTANLELVRSLGAEAVIDHRHEELDRGRRRLRPGAGHRRSDPSASSASCARRAGHARDRRREGGNRLTGGVGRQLRAVALSPFVAQRLTTFISTERGESIGGRDLPGQRRGRAGHLTARRPGGVPDTLQRLESGVSGGKAVVVIRDVGEM